jgi:hypothetical protein
MKIIDYVLANAALILSLDDVRPVHGFVFPQLVSEIGEKCTFSVKPNLASPTRMQIPRPDGLGFAMAQTPWAFEDGNINVNGTPIKIPRLELAPDFSMVVVHTSTTEEGDQVLTNMASHLEAVLGFRNIVKTSRKRYGSNLVFEFDAGVEEAVRMIADMERLISPILRAATGINLEAKWDRISFSFDPLDIPPSKSNQPVTFLIERRAGRPFEDHR